MFIFFQFYRIVSFNNRILFKVAGVRYFQFYRIVSDPPVFSVKIYILKNL